MFASAPVSRSRESGKGAQEALTPSALCVEDAIPCTVRIGVMGGLPFISNIYDDII